MFDIVIFVILKYYFFDIIQFLEKNKIFKNCDNTFSLEKRGLVCYLQKLANMLYYL